MAGKAGRSGRKRDGADIKVNFNTKIDHDLRDRLQDEAKKNSRSLSREIELRLRNSFKRKLSSDGYVRALQFVIEEAARLTSTDESNWVDDEMVCAAFIGTVMQLMSMVRSTHRSGPPDHHKGFSHPLFKTPEDLANATTFHIGNMLANAEDLKDVVDLRPDDPRRAYAAAAAEIGRPKRWVDYSHRRMARDSNPELQRVRNELDEYEAKNKRFPPAGWYRDWRARVNAISAKY